MCAIFILWCISELDVPVHTQDFLSLSSKLLSLMCAFGEDDIFSKNWSELKQVFKNENVRYIKVQYVICSCGLLIFKYFIGNELVRLLVVLC